MNNKFAGFWIRVGASVIDAFIFLIPVYAIDYLLYGLTGPDMPYLDYLLDEAYADMWTTYDTVSLITALLLGISYYGLLTSKLGGTIGKLVLGLRVVGEDGEKISFGRAIGRYFSYVLSNIFYIGYIMVAFTENKRGLHDFICKTYVIRK